MTRTPDSFAQRLADARRAAGHATIFDFAEACPTISEPVLRNLESGRKAYPSIEQLLELGEVLNISPVVLIPQLDPAVAASMREMVETLRAITNQAASALQRLPQREY